MNKYQQQQLTSNNHHNNYQLDGYEAEIVEDIPEQFDLSRYKKSNKSASGSSGDASPFLAYPRPPPPPPTHSQPPSYFYPPQPYSAANYMHSTGTLE